MKISIEDFYSQCKNLFFLRSGQKYGLHSSQVSNALILKVGICHEHLFQESKWNTLSLQ